MSSVGAHLRELRTQRGVSLEEISRSTRVLTQYLEALETDRYEALPAPVFTKGFIRAYCQALGVPPDESLAIYEGRPGGGTDVKPAAHEPRPAAQPAPVSEAAAKRREAAENRTRGAVLAGFVLLVVLGVALFAVTLWLHPAPAPLEGGRAAEPQAAPPVPAPPLSCSRQLWSSLACARTLAEHREEANGYLHANKGKARSAPGRVQVPRAVQRRLLQGAHGGGDGHGSRSRICWSIGRETVAACRGSVRAAR